VMEVEADVAIVKVRTTARKGKWEWRYI
jgi:hypothetical protein